mgnify:CR=1 FL=1
MKRKILYSISLVVFIAATWVIAFPFARGEESVRRVDVAKAIAEKICLDIMPGVSDFPDEEQYEIISNALASRGIDNFIGTNPDELFTIGEIEGLYYLITSGIEIDPSDPRANCPVELISVFAVLPDSQLTSDDFQKVLECLPDCDSGAQDYTAPPPPGFVPEGPDVIPEESAGEI